MNYQIFKRGYDSVMAQLEQPFAGPIQTSNKTLKLQGEALAKAKGLQKFDFNGVIIYARNEKEAIKRAKKRGLLKLY